MRSNNDVKDSEVEDVLQPQNANFAKHQSFAESRARAEYDRQSGWASWAVLQSLTDYLPSESLSSQALEVSKTHNESYTQ